MTTPAETPVTALARRFRVNINMGSGGADDFQMLPAITNLTWTADPNIEVSTVYEDDGWEGNEKTGQAWRVTVTFNRKKSKDSTAYNAVHEALRTAALAWGEDAKVELQLCDRQGGPEAYQGFALVTWTPQGGEATALDSVQVLFTGDGPLTPITNPLAA
jgi:hypothetical protein